MSAVEVNKVNPSSGTNLQLGDSGDTITIPAGATFDSSAATNTLPANVVTTDGTQTLTNKSIVATQLTGTITPSDNTVTTAKIVDANVTLDKLSATGTKDATTFLRGDNSFAAAGGTNTPAFHVSLGSTQTPSNNVATKVALDTELVDTDNAFASNKFTVPVGKAGTYFIRGQVEFVQGDGNASTVNYGFTNIYKNGSQINGDARIDFRNNAGFGMNISTSVVITLAEGDYIELYGRLNASLPRFLGGVVGTFLQGYKLLT